MLIIDLRPKLSLFIDIRAILLARHTVLIKSFLEALVERVLLAFAASNVNGVLLLQCGITCRLLLSLTLDGYLPVLVRVNLV